jgi:hypothetical protein
MAETHSAVWSFDRARGERERAAYRGAQPFPHVVIEDLLPVDEAEAGLRQFPDKDDAVWTREGRLYESAGNGLKLELARFSAMGPALRRIIEGLQTPAFVEYLEALTGIDHLLPDPDLFGGGLNLVATGGYLRTHADFNFNNDKQAYRSVNLLLYLNHGWTEEDGGSLELWNVDLSACVRKVVPGFNRAVIFSTTDAAYHGYGRVNRDARKSINLYYYRTSPPPGVSPVPHRTNWI